MRNGVNLDKLKDEISNRKRGKSSSVDNNGVVPRDAFLYGLMESLNTGKETESSALVKTVDNVVAVKNKEVARLPINEMRLEQKSEQRQRPIINEGNNFDADREEQLYADLEKKRKLTLTESIEALNKKNTDAPRPMQYQSNSQLTESVVDIVNTHLIENFSAIVDESMKSSIIEMYAVERIKNVLQQNKDLIKSIVIEVIRELQAKNKKS